MVKYTFNHWEVDGVNVGSANPLTVGPITADTRIVAVYAVVTHRVTFDSTPSGIIYTQPSGQGAGSSLTVDDGISLTVQVPPTVEA